VLHDSPLVSGLIIAPQGVVGFAAGVFGARLMRRLGLHRLTLVAGATAMIGFLVLTQLPGTGGYSPVLAAVTLVGFGTAVGSYVSMIGASSGMADSDQGFVGGAINTSRQIGAAVGAALLPAIAEAVSPGSGAASVSGDRAAMLAGAIAAGLAIVVAMRLGTAPATRTATTPITAAQGDDRPTGPVELCPASSPS
jgi:MFS family permease